jgi:hypothetical protein
MTTATNGVVYVTNKSPTHDYVSATSYGALRFVTMGNYPVFKTARLIEEITTALVYSRPEDFILFSGSAVVSALVMSVWLEMHGKANVLLWDRVNSKYVLRPIDRQNLAVGIEAAMDQLGIPRNQ